MKYEIKKYLIQELFFFFSSNLLDVLASIDLFGLEDNLPDELVSTSNWGDQISGNKPPAQGPGPGNQINGDDPGVPSVTLQRQLQQHQLQHHIMQQQVDNFTI